MPRVSVLMPLHKVNPALLRASLDCVLAQTMTDWEIVMVNDPLDPTTPEHIKEYLEDPRIRFHQEDTPRGIGANWNACLKYATADYLAYLFYDDLWEPTYLETLAGILDAHPDVGFASANRTYLFEGDVPKSAVYDEVKEFSDAHITPGQHEGVPLLLWWMNRGLRPNFLGEPSFVMFRRSLLERVGPFHETMVQFLDSEYWTRCLAKGNWYWEPTVLGKFRVHAAGTTAQNEFAGKGLFDRMVTFDAAIGLLPAEHRAHAKKALRHALAGMVRRYFERKKEGKAMGGGGGDLKKFCLRHPLLVAGALLEALFGTTKT